MSPEIIFLSCSAIQTTENYNRCDVYSLAVVFIELLAHKTFKEITNDYGMKNIDKNNLIFATMLFTGIPTVNELKKYLNFIFDFTKKVDKEDDTEKNRSQCTRNMRYLKTVIEIVKEIESIVVDNDEEYYDRFKDDFGVSASIFFKGIAFDYLEKNIPNTGLQHLMKRMTVWDFETRMTSAEAMLHPVFDILKAKNPNTDYDDMWFLQYMKTQNLKVNRDDNYKGINDPTTRLAEMKNFETKVKDRKKHCQRKGCVNQLKSLNHLQTINDVQFCSESCENVYNRLIKNKK